MTMGPDLNDRARFIVDDIATRTPPEVETVRVTGSAEWLAKNRGGFAPMSVLYFEYDPHHIAKTTAHLNVDELEVYLTAITSWWWFSAVEQEAGRAGVVVLQAFTDRDPEGAVWLALIAAHHRCTTLEWVGAG